VAMWTTTLRRALDGRRRQWLGVLDGNVHCSSVEWGCSRGLFTDHREFFGVLVWLFCDQGFDGIA